jgi:hypothetical protein
VCVRAHVYACACACACVRVCEYLQGFCKVRVSKCECGYLNIHHTHTHTHFLCRLQLCVLAPHTLSVQAPVVCPCTTHTFCAGSFRGRSRARSGCRRDASHGPRRPRAPAWCKVRAADWSACVCVFVLRVYFCVYARVCVCVCVCVCVLSWPWTTLSTCLWQGVAV